MKVYGNIKIKKMLVVGIICLFISTAFSPAVVSIKIVQNIELKEENGKRKNIQIKAGDGTTEYYAIVAGCARYIDPMNNLPITWVQLRYLYFSLLAAPNWKAKNIIALFNDVTDPLHPLLTAGGATRENILKALDYMATKVDGDDVFLFAWLGHGSQVDDDNGDERTILRPFDKYDEVICPFNCYREYPSGILYNYIRDDTLEEKFNAIGGKGQCLIFESCFSGGLVKKDVTGDGALDANGNGRIDPEEADDFSEDLKLGFEESNTNDVNGPGRIVIVASLDDTVARLTYLFGGTLTAGMALGLLGQYRGSKKDTNDDGFISVEEAFRWAKPRMYGALAAFWVSLWLYFVAVEYFLHEDSEHQMLDAIINGTKWFFVEYAYVQLTLRIKAGVWAATVPHMIDGYNKPGGLNIVKLNPSDEENVLSKLSLPKEIYTFNPTVENWNDIYNFLKTETSLGDEQLRECMPSVEDYLQVSWDDNPPEYMPGVFSEIEGSYTGKPYETIGFSGVILGGEEPYTITWDFGDGTTGTGLTPTHKYKENGVYTVTFKVVDGQGRTAQDLYSLGVSKTTVTIGPKDREQRYDVMFLKFCKSFPVIGRLLSIIFLKNSH